MAESRNVAITAAVIGAAGTIVAALIATGAIGGGGGGGGSGGGGGGSTQPSISVPTGNASVFLNRDSGPGGTEVRVSGEGFKPQARVVLRFHTEQIGSSTTDGQGRFTNVTVKIPGSFSKFAPQQFSIIAQQDFGAHAEAPFTITG